MENHLRLYLFHSLLWCFSFIIFNFFRLWNLIMDLSNYNSPFPPISLIHFPYYPYHHNTQQWYHWIYFYFFTFSIYIIIMNKSILLELTFSRRWVSRCWIFLWFFSWFAFNRYHSQFSSHFFQFSRKMFAWQSFFFMLCMSSLFSGTDGILSTQMLVVFYNVLLYVQRSRLNYLLPYD